MVLVMGKNTANFTEAISERVTRMCKELGYTQAEIADQLGTLQSVVSAYESGGRRFHAETIAKY